MTTYVYETITGNTRKPAKRYEIRQSMKDSPLTVHPETGEPIRRVIMGGYGVMKAGGSPAPAPSSGHSCGGGGCGCC